MIRLLTENDRINVLKYLYKDASLNIFIIGDIEAFGFEEDFQTLYGDFDNNDNYLSVLLYYREHSIFYAHDSNFNEEWLKIMAQHNFEHFSGRKSVMDKIQNHFPSFKVTSMYFAEAKEMNFKEEDNDYIINKVESVNDMEKLFYILESITEFSIAGKEKDDFIEGKKKGLEMGVTYFIEEEDVIISTVATTAETTVNAMVVAVATKESARKRGLASILMKHLINEYITNKKKYLCLFYDNPLAGNIYKRLGFKDVDQWVMLSKNK